MSNIKQSNKKEKENICKKCMYDEKKSHETPCLTCIYNNGAYNNLVYPAK